MAPSRVPSGYSGWGISTKCRLGICCGDRRRTHGLGRLVLPEAPERFIPTEREAHGIAPLPIDEESTLHLSRLPALHRDPFDRLLVSQAIVHGLTIVTPDPLVRQYPARTLW